MHSTRILSITLCLGLACVMLTANAIAGKTKADVRSYAKELGKDNQVYTLPTVSGETFITRSMNVVRDAAQDFVLRLTLSSNAEFQTTSIPADTDVSLGVVAGGAITPSVVDGGKDGDTFVDYLIDITGTGFSSFPTLHIDPTTWTIKDVDNVLGGGGTITITVQTFDASNNIEFDTGTATVDWLKGKNGVAVKPSLKATTATIDVRKARLEFVPTTGALDPADNDDAATDHGATVGIDASKSGVLGLDGGTYLATVDDLVKIVIEGDLAGITEITWDSSSSTNIPAVDAITIKASEAVDKGFDVTNGKATITIKGNSTSLDGKERQISITVDSSTTLTARTLTITVLLDLKDGTGGLSANDRDLVGKTNLTIWKLNGTVLIANFMNGNNAVFNGRIYLFNPSTSAGDISIRVFTLPLTGASTQIGSATLDLGSLAGNSGRNIRLAEDILTPLAVTLPYTDDAGNMVVEVTIEAPSVTGVGQVFQLDLSSFGIYPLSAVN